MARPLGSQNKDKPFREALRLELAALEDSDPKSLRALARNLLKLAASEKDALHAIREVADRLDGKPAQEASIEVATVRYVARVPEKANTAEKWQQQHSPELTQH